MDRVLLNDSFSQKQVTDELQSFQVILQHEIRLLNLPINQCISHFIDHGGGLTILKLEYALHY